MIERRDHILLWYLDGQLVLRYEDAHPLKGRYFGFGNWSSEVQFDNLRIDQLPYQSRVKEVGGAREGHKDHKNSQSHADGSK